MARLPRFNIETDERTKKMVKLKCVRQGKTIREVLETLIKKWLEKK